MDVTVPTHSLKHNELLEMLIQHFNIHEGNYSLTFEFKIATGAIGFDPEQFLPSVMVGVSAIGIVKADCPGPNTMNAAECNPSLPKTRRKAKPAAVG